MKNSISVFYKLHNTSKRIYGFNQLPTFISRKMCYLHLHRILDQSKAKFENIFFILISASFFDREN